MTIKQFSATVLVAAGTTLGTAWGYGQYQQNHSSLSVAQESTSLFRNAGFTGISADPVADFEKAASKAVPAVVHIKTLTRAKQTSTTSGQEKAMREMFGEGFEDLFGGRGNNPSRAQRASGSGVIISADGYIVTNNHVVEGADELSVTLSNNKTYKGRIVGKDPSSDLAVVKIEASSLPFLTFANSDNVHLGQSVLAVGYPLNLDVTVTSGIVSAKSRSIGVNSRNSKTPVEAFLQTDAAINPGNSGGALVNVDGDLIGINSAIASPTGTYAGYGYAIPANMVKKITSDIVKFGSSKRAYLGVMFGNGQTEEETGARSSEGVYVMEVAGNSAAAEAGLRKGDYITKINGASTVTGTQVIEKVAAMRPGDKVNITYQRNGVEKTASATLKGEVGVYASMKS